jgi:hypothetical protein
MGLVTGLLTLPLAPVRGTIALAEQVLRQAEREYYDAGSIRRQIEQIDDAQERGELTEQEAGEMQDVLVERLLEGRSRGQG